MIRQVRPREPSARRPACDSRVSRVTCCTMALPNGLSGPIGWPQTSTSSTALASPSTLTTSRALNRCWGTAAASPCATSVACGWAAAGEDVQVEAVVVVAHRGEIGDHEAALAAGLGRAIEDVGVLPQDAEVFLVDADGVGNGARLAGVVGDGGVQVGDLAQAVAAELERVGPRADQVLAGVEVGLPVPELRVAVGYDHLRDRGPVEHRAAGQADLVQGQALAGVEADPHRPVLPAQRVSLQGEAGPLGLG